MWPWEHVVVGYLAFSAASHLWRRRSPRAGEAALVVLASLLPDLIDKPLAWSLQLVSGGYGPAHSTFFVLPALAILCGRWWLTDRRWRGVAFATGYLLHVSGDVFFNAMDGTVDPEVFLWPVLVYEPSGERAGFAAETVLRVSKYLANLFSGDVSTYTTIQLGLLAVTIVLWMYDGAPVLRQSLDWTRGRLRERQ
jgi:membrane-bound metal-dependent hydrolase YbcI (DUF457 family)